MQKKPYKSAAKPAQPEKPQVVTSWENVADWYDEHLETNPDSYQAKVIAPNLIRLISPKVTTRILDLACGQGFFSRAFAAKGALVTGADISPQLIKQAKKHSPGIEYHVTPADKLPFAKDGSYDVVTIVLAIQNISNMEDVFKEAHRVLSSGGKLMLVLNHPTFRIPKRSAWDWDAGTKTQYRRVDGYLSTATVPIAMHPGQKNSEETVSYHRPLQDFFKTFAKTGFAVTRLEEWISHKKSQNGPRQIAEDRSRKEIPLFMMIEATKR